MFFNLLEGQEPQNSNIGTIIALIAIVVLIVGMIVWQSYSNKKKQKQAQDMLESIKIGDKVKTIGGVCGYLVEINKNENTIVLETGNDKNKCYVKFDRNAIYQTGPATSTVAPQEQVTAKAEEKQVEEKVTEENVVEEKAVEEKAESDKK